mmetsp:Transcript_34362/g.55764  ORF Transcript_34362/g.55764 Transcript_34362/m.55764 type:complete len:278 (+) Transcript_34362:1366-2199(+)
MVSVVEITAYRHLVLVLRALDACRVAAGDEEASSDVATRLAVPLDLCWPCIKHRGGPNSHHGVGGKHPFLNDHLVLVDSHIERHVVGLRPSSERREPEERFLVAHGFELTTGILHEIGVTSVRWVTGLERIDCVGSRCNESLAKLFWGEAILVKTVVVPNAFQEFDFTPKQVRARCHHHFDVGVVGVHASEDTGNDLFFAVVVDLRVGEHGYRLAGWCGQGHLSRGANELFGRGSDRKDDGDRHIDTFAHLQLGTVVVEVGASLWELCIACQIVWIR